MAVIDLLRAGAGAGGDFIGPISSLTGLGFGGIACSGDGKTVIASSYANAGDYGYTGEVYKSLDSGRTWAIIGRFSGLYNVGMSADANTLFALDGNSNYLIASDDGTTFTRSGTITPARHLTCSGSGNIVYLFTIVPLNQYVNMPVIAKSVDAGNTFSFIDLPSLYLGGAVSTNIDGSIVFAVSDYIYKSIDGGVTFDKITTVDNSRTSNISAFASQIFTAYTQTWCAVAISADGSKIVASKSTGDTFTSADSGQTWKFQPLLSLYQTQTPTYSGYPINYEQLWLSADGLILYGASFYGGELYRFEVEY